MLDLELTGTELFHTIHLSGPPALVAGGDVEDERQWAVDFAWGDDGGADAPRLPLSIHGNFTLGR